MKKLKLLEKAKAFLYVYKNSLINPQYYKDLFEVDINFSIKYYVVLITSVALLSSLIMGIKEIPQMSKNIRVAIEETKNLFPDDLIITIQNKEWTINKEEPFIIPTPLDKFENMEDVELPNGEIPKNLIIFDREGTIPDMEEQDTLILINKTNIIVKTQDGTNSIPLEETFPFKKLDNYQLTKSDFNRILDAAAYIPWVLPFVAFLSGFFGLAVGGAMEAMIITALLLVISLIMRVVINVADVFKITLHTSTMIFTVQLFLGAFNLYLAYPILFWLAHVSYGVIVLFAINKGKQG